MDNRRLYVAAYDIREPRRLREALKVMKGYSTGGQKSVFECFLTEREHSRVLTEMGAVIDVGQDDFLIVRIDDPERCSALGIGAPPRNPPFFWVE